MKPKRLRDAGRAMIGVPLALLACARAPYVAAPPSPTAVDRDTGWKVESEPAKVSTAPVPTPAPASNEAVASADNVARDTGPSQSPADSPASANTTTDPPSADSDSAEAVPAARFALPQPKLESAVPSGTPPENPQQPATPRPEARTPPALRPANTTFHTSLEVPPDDDRPSKPRRPADPATIALSASLSAGGIWGTDFEGRTFLASGNGSSVDVVLVPKLARGAGTSVGGYFAPVRVDDLGMWVGLEYQRTWLSASFAGIQVGDAALHEVSFPLRVAGAVNDTYTFYFDMSGGVAFLNVEKAAATADSQGMLIGAPVEASMTGTSYTFALGGMFFVVPDRFAIDTRVAYRAYFFDTANGGTLDESLAAGSYELRVGPALQF